LISTLDAPSVTAERLGRRDLIQFTPTGSVNTGTWVFTTAATSVVEQQQRGF
jgi:hypothetical protein